MRNIKYHLIIICILSIFASCSNIYENGKELAKDSKDGIKQISAKELQAKIDGQEEFLLIDVRQEVEYDKGNITGSVLIARGVLEFKIREEAFWEEMFMYTPEDTTQIIVYCKAGDRGILAAKALQKIGFKNVKNLEGGFAVFNPDFESIVVEKDEGGCGG